MISDLRTEKINSKYIELIEACNSFASESELKLIHKAYELACKAEVNKHKDRDDLRVYHSIEVALIAVNEMGLGVISVVCALLHNLFEAKEISQTEIHRKFNKTTVSIVLGFNKISNLQTAKISAQSDNFRKLFLTLVDDIRVILIKICHRLYDMRNYESLSEEKQLRYLDEVLYLYIPIAHRLGLYNIKSDMEELAMKYSHTEIYNSLVEKIQASKTKQNSFLKEFINPLEREMIVHGFDCEFKGRPKSVSSIWNKMKKQNLDFEEVFDIFAIRIISNSETENEKEDCWKIYSIVTNIYSPNPKRLRDWITTPKASGYESLHTTVKDPNGKWVEVQIRTKRMDTEAERGQAAHWRYKEFGTKKDAEGWLNQVRDIIENPDQINFDGLYEDHKKNQHDKIFIFTPNGDLKQLPIGSTVLDFAYEIHTNIGSSCSGAKINNKAVPIRHILENGDKVEIITSKNQKPKLDWLNFVITNKAKGRIKRSMLEEKYKEAEAGQEIIRRKFKTWRIPYNEESIDKVIKYFKLKSSIDLFNSVATESLDIRKIKKIFDKDESNDTKFDESQALEKNKTLSNEGSDSLIINESLKDINYSLARCCNPISGDSVFGFVTVGKGITIHRVNCPNAAQMIEKYSYRIIEVKWHDAGELPFYVTKIRVTGKDTIGILGELSDVISKDLKVKMLSTSIESNDDQFEGKIKVQVRNNKHLEELLHKLLRVKGVLKAIRVDDFR